MEIFFFLSRIKNCLYNELFLIYVLWCFENFFKRSYMFCKLGFFDLFLLFEKYFFLGVLK